MCYLFDDVKIQKLYYPPNFLFNILLKYFSPAIRNPKYSLAVAKQNPPDLLCRYSAQQQKTPQLKVVGFPIRVLNYLPILHYITFRVTLIRKDSYRLMLQFPIV
jgi:hypothetical protein